MFLLLEKITDTEKQLAGYGWRGLTTNPTFKDYPITSAYRLGANATGKRLAADFIKGILSVTKNLFAGN